MFIALYRYPEYWRVQSVASGPNKTTLKMQLQNDGFQVDFIADVNNPSEMFKLGKASSGMYDNEILKLISESK